MNNDSSSQSTTYSSDDESSIDTSVYTNTYRSVNLKKNSLNNGDLLGIEELCKLTNKDFGTFIHAFYHDIGDVFKLRKWKHTYVKPTNHVIQDYNLKLSKYKELCGDIIFKSKIQCAKFAAYFIDDFIVLTTKTALLRNNLNKVQNDTTEICKYLLKTITFHYKEEKKYKKISLETLVLDYTPIFHEYDDLVCKWNHDKNNTSEFSLSSPYRGKLLNKEEYDIGYVNIFIKWIYECISDSTIIKFNHVLDWIEHTIRFPDSKTGVALVLYSKEKGLGKSSLYKMIEAIVGNYNTVIESKAPIRLTHERNSHVLGKKIASIEEMEEGSHKLACDKLKDMISAFDMITTPLYSQTLKIENRLNFIITTNNLGALYMPVNDMQKLKENIRRFSILKVSNKYFRNTEFYTHFYQELKTQKFADHMFTYFTNRNELKSDKALFNIITDEIKTICYSQLPSHVSLMEELRSTSLDDFPPELMAKMYNNNIRFLNNRLYAYYLKYCELNRFKNTLNSKQFATKISEIEWITKQKSNGIYYLIIALTEDTE